MVCLFFYVQFGLSQEAIPKISLSYENRPVSEVLQLIEEASGLPFYYVEQWLGEKTISGSFDNASVPVILESIFKDTPINFYVLDGQRVILTRNTIIYDELPGGFFGRKDSIAMVERTEKRTTVVNPVFYNENRTSTTRKLETVRIGKADPDNSAQSFLLQGYVRNKNTGEPLQDLTILVKGRGIGAVTDANGFYSIRLPAGQNVLRTSSMGIQGSEREVVIYNNGTLDFELEESLELLEEVVVEADAAKNVEEATTGTTQIVSEESKNIPLVLGERDILRVATTLPGITTAGEGAAGYNVRGGKTDQNLILLDDAVIYNPSHFFGIFQALNPYTTKGVDIYKGNIPAEYGGRLSSVFDIETKDGNVEKFAGEASIGPVTANIALEIPLKKEKSSLVVGGRGAYSDWILRSLDDEQLSNSTASFYDGIVKFNSNINENNDIRATGYYSRDAFSITSDSLFNYSNRGFSLRWDHKFNEKNTGSLIAANSQYRFNIDFDGESNNDFGLGYKIDETELKLKLRYLPNDKHTFTYGLAAKYYGVDPGSIEPEGSNSIIQPVAIPRESAIESAVYLSDEYQISDKLLFDLGLRYSFFASLGATEKRTYADGLPRSEGTLIAAEAVDGGDVIATYGGPEIRASARYFLGPDLSVKASFNSGYQFIHTLSNNTTVSPIDTWKLSDNNIEPQTGNQYSLGFYKNLKENEYEISLEGYYKTSKNVLDFKTGAQLLLNQTIETEVLQGNGRAYGVEFLIRKDKGKLNGWLGYTYSRSLIQFDSEFSEERINNGEFFPSNFDKPHDISLVANYKFTRRYSLSANFVYQTGRPVTYPIGTYQFNNSEFVFYSNRNEFRIPDYYRLDLGINIEGNHRIKKFAHSFWTISVYNVLGRNNPYSVFFVTEEGEVKALQSSIFAIPIPSITYNFKF
ncbi:TonB-dependent receptor [Flavobacteriaceae bacterium TP-CH-4]|uniref:TonB-dependent receptor n=1 Tax=Pelagihabitans pacificus TaxID=2696054 RepID=A0A967EDY5_9FLAO|nr:TonB-dependent receptor [Pelagihabitans pacificus]